MSQPASANSVSAQSTPAAKLVADTASSDAVAANSSPVASGGKVHCFENVFSRWLPAALGLGLAACSQLPPSAEPDVPLYDAQATASQLASGKSNKTVTILGQFTEENEANFAQTLVPFEEQTGIDVVFETTDNFNNLLKMRVASFSAPDIAILPQPGFMTDLAEGGHLVPLTDVIDIHALRAAYPQAWLTLGSVEEVPYGLWFRASVKSLVWYNPAAFEAKGYAIPRSWAELTALSAKMVADGGTPWCIGLESGAASGWPGTDWVEDILLRTGGPEAYHQWVTHQMPFNSPPVVNAFKEFGKLLQSDGYVSGGPEKAMTTPFTESVAGIFQTPPECYMHRQANFITASFPEGTRPKVDYDVFLLPGIDPNYGTPLLVAGDAIVMFRQTPASEALLRYLATPQPHEIWAGLGGYISPHKKVALDVYPDVVTQTIAQILREADVIRFDGSDLMPGIVGTDLFWAGMLEFAKGASAEEVTQSIEDGWP